MLHGTSFVKEPGTFNAGFYLRGLSGFGEGVTR